MNNNLLLIGIEKAEGLYGSNDTPIHVQKVRKNTAQVYTTIYDCDVCDIPRCPTYWIAICNNLR